MTFYGNLNNIARSQLHFDAIYHTRSEMDANVTIDNVFAGRYVLVEYDGNGNSDSEVYAANYDIDAEKYGNTRGYDSTVWMKTYTPEGANYIMVADLNALTPSIQLIQNAPSDTSETFPYFDDKSSNVSYNLHMQPAWDIRVKEALNRVLWIDPDDTSKGQYYLSSIDTESPSDEKINGRDVAIYYNAAGFNASKINKSRGISDAIQLTKSGRSGKLYQDPAHPDQQSVEIDTQELSIMLPSIGNTISNVYDAMYGAEGMRRSDGLNITNTRAMNVDWVNYGEGYPSDRLSMFSQDGNIVTDSINSKNSPIQTVAGSINTMHDTLGMIIKETNSVHEGDVFEVTDNEAINGAVIYYDTTTLQYLYLQPSYVFTDETYSNSSTTSSKPFEKVSDINNAFEEIVDKTNFATFPANKYYVLKNNNYVLASNYIANATYYELGSEEAIEFDEYQSGKYYVYSVDSTGVKRYDKSYDVSPKEGTTYLTYDSSNLEVIGPIQAINGIYIPGKYYKDAGDGSVIEETESAVFDANGTYYVKKFVDQKQYLPEPMPSINSATFIPGVYYTEADFIPGQDVDLQTQLPYGDKIYTLATEYYIGANYYKITPIINARYMPGEEVTLIPFEPNTVFTDTGNAFVSIPTSDKIDTSCLTLYVRIKDADFIPKQFKTYQSNRYYYKTNQAYILDTASSKTANRTYYNITMDPVTNEFFEANKYYQKTNNSYHIIGSASMPNTPIYAIKDEQDWWVKEGNDIFMPYSHWNPLIDVPDGVELAKRKRVYVATDLQGLAKDYNTMFGSIVKSKQSISANDYTTRDLNTVQGAINSVNDLLSNIGTLEPKKFLFTNEYGQIVSDNGDGLRSMVNDEINESLSNVSLDKIGGANKIITSIAQSNGQISAEVMDATAANISIADADNKFTGTNVETALNELMTSLNSALEYIGTLEERITTLENSIQYNQETGNVDIEVEVPDDTEGGI